MFKFGTIGAFKQVRNNPRNKATRDLQDGFVVLMNDVAGTAPTPAVAADGQGLEVYVVGNIIDKPETYDSKTFTTANGEYVRAFRLADAVGLPVEIDDRVIVTAYTSLAKGDKLVPAIDGSGKWVKADGTTIVATAYKINLEITDKTTFGGKGIVAAIRVN